MNNISHSNAYYAALRNRFKTLFNRYKVNTLADGGTVRNDSITQAYMKFCQTNRISDSIKLAIFPEAGIKTVSGRVSKAYGLPSKLLSGDSATQATTGSQPYLSGNIAPNERYALKNPNGGSNYMTHPTISFGATDSWSVTTVLNWNGEMNANCDFFGKTSTGKVTIKRDGNYVISISGFTLSLDFRFNFDTKKLIGKTNTITLSKIGTTASLYINGVFIDSQPFNSTLEIDKVFEAYRYSPAFFKGKIHAHIIHAQALTATEVLNEYDFLRPYYPEIESVVIGTQTWATSNCEMAYTPQGNLIANVTDNTIWASSQTLYDNAYNAAGGVGGGTAAIYAGVKAAAMWCHYNNDSALGAVYGKLYNWFAVKLLQMDIDYYNTANPTNPWGWRVPTQADFQTLSTYLGGDAVSGGKMKVAGTTYWNSPNTGADNSSGFTMLGTGYRNGSGNYIDYKSYGLLAYLTKDSYIFMYLGSSSLNAGSISNIGLSLRLIKA